MKLKRILSSAAVAATLLCAGVANAALYQFTVTGDYAASWRLDTDVEPDVVIEELGLTYYGVAGSYANAASGFAHVSFFNGDFGGGVSLEDAVTGEYLLVTDGPQIYAGSGLQPSYVPGTYALNEYQGTGSYTLTISAVPEPATLGMLLAGMGLVGFALRRRQGN